MVAAKFCESLSSRLAQLEIFSQNYSRRHEKGKKIASDMHRNYRNRLAKAAFRRKERKRYYRSRQKCVRLNYYVLNVVNFSRATTRSKDFPSRCFGRNVRTENIVNGNEPTVSIAVRHSWWKKREYILKMSRLTFSLADPGCDIFYENNVCFDL